MDALKLIFWAALCLLLYTYLGYPVLLFVLNKIIPPRGSGTAKKAFSLPGATVLVAAYNEEKVIAGKIENTLSLDYPEALLKVIIASDGSSDRTNGIVRSYMERHKNLSLLEFPRIGKSGVINNALRHIASEIVVFSDANTEFDPLALKKLMRHFLDPNVGCVCGRLIYRNPGGAVSGEGESFYWRYETLLKKMENRLGYIAGANGAIYAIRTGLFEPLRQGTINDDFVISMRIVEKGFRSVYEEGALAYEDVAKDMKSEFKRHVRDSAGHYIAVTHLLGLLNPLYGVKAFIYWSHRVLRWAAPFFMIALIIINLLLIDFSLYKGLLYLQAGFYAVALAGLLSVKHKFLPFFMYVPFYLCNLNLALLCGFLKAVTGAQKPAWERTERA